MKDITFAQVVKNRGFLNLWLNQILVQLSYNSLNFALIIWVFHLTDSNTAVSVLLFAVYLPAIIFGLFAGVLIDITDRKRVIMMINLLFAFSFFSLIFFKESYITILIITFFINALSQFYVTAESSAIPLVVPRKQLLIANSIFTTTLFGCFLLGFGLAGPLINFLDIDFVFGIGGVILLLAYLLTFRFPSIVNKSGQQGRKLSSALSKKDFWSILTVGINEMKNTLSLIKGKLAVSSSLLILAGIQVVIGVLAVLVPSFMERDLHIKATDVSYVVIIPLGLGMVLGGLLVNKLAKRWPKRIIAGRGILLAGLLLFAVGVAPLISPVINYFPKPRPLPFFYQPPLSTVLFFGSFLLGIAMVSIVVPSQTVLQENTPEQDRGKVYSVLGVLMSALTVIPILLAGGLADIFGTQPIFTALGGVIILIGFFTLRPSFYFDEHHLPYKVREFLGLGHWKNGKS